MKALLIDPRTGGIAGDMLCAALCDLTGSAEPLHAIAEAIERLPRCSAFEISLGRTNTPCSAACVSVNVVEENGPGADIAREMDEVLATTGLSSPGAAMAHAILDDLLSVRARFHPEAAPGQAFSSVDTIFDILGPLALIEDAGLSGCPVYTTPPALGGGVIPTPGGAVGGPAPASLEICARHRMPVSESPLLRELTTPTGAALLANLARVVTRFPAMTPLRTGYGASAKDHGSETSILRVVEGEITDLTEERIVILETNLDDVDGETIGFTRERLFAAGAVDVFVTPASGKKNRPVQVLSVITSREDYLPLVRLLMDETGTLGVRMREEPRLVADRVNEKIGVMVNNQPFTVRIKISRAGGKVISVKPEYEDLKQIALTLGIPLRHVMREVYRQLPCNP